VAIDGYQDPFEEAALLRARVEAFEARWAAVEARLRAFDRLEELAREQATTPEVLAARSALAVVERRLATYEAEAEQREQRLAVLGCDLQELDAARDEAGRRLADATRELEVLGRERRRLAEETERCREELAGLVAERASRLRELDGLDHAPAVRAATMPDPALLELGDDDEPDARAFEEFFNAEFEHDKSRDWILGGADAPSAG
jgi:chromosome segregation ATPase